MNRNESFGSAQVNTLVVHLAWASLEMMVDDVSDLQVMVSGDDNDVSDLKISCADGRLLVEQPTYGLTIKLNTDRWMQLFLRIPREWKGAVEASTISGLLNVRGLTGTDLSLETVSADLRASGLSGITLALKSATGDIQAASVAAEKLAMRTVSGAISLHGAQARQVKLTSVSGENDLAFTAPFDRLDGNTVSGGIRVYAPMDVADVTLAALSGRLRTSNVSLKENAPVIRVSSVSGDLEINNNQQN